ncbi:MAG: hypothetical protein WDA00_07715, partial [Eubacteriales bacterium]
MKTHARKRSVIGMAFLLVLLLCLMTMVFTQAKSDPEVWDGTIATEFAGGDGSAEHPFQISNGAQLAYLADRTAAANYLILDEDGETELFNYRTASYVLTADITLNEGTFAADGTWSELGAPNAWTPIPEFRGTFDGDGHTISGMWISGTSAGQRGFFGFMSAATVKNLTIENSYVRGVARTGMLAGETGVKSSAGGSSQKSFLENITVSGYVVATGTGADTPVGGMVGKAHHITISRSTSNVDVNATTRVGGFFGYSEGAKVYDCVNNGTVIGTGEVAGFVGYISLTTGVGSTYYRNCVNNGAVTSTGTAASYSAGGILGRADVSNLHILFDNCVNTGAITGKNNVGGIFGYMEAGLNNNKTPAGIRSSLSLGTVSASEEGAYVGMLAGYASSDHATFWVRFLYNYYIAQEGVPAIGAIDPQKYHDIGNFAVTAEQLAGTATDLIDETEETYAYTASVTTALNRYVAELNKAGSNPWTLTESDLGDVTFNTWTQGEERPVYYRQLAPLYALTVFGAENGALTVEALENSVFPDDFPLSSYSAGTEITFTTPANEGYYIRLVSYTAGSVTTDVFPDGEGYYSFVMPESDVTFNLLFVSEEAEAYDITYAECEGVTEWSSYQFFSHLVGYATVIPNPAKPGYIFKGWLVNDATEAVTDLTLGAEDYTADI